MKKAQLAPIPNYHPQWYTMLVRKYGGSAATTYAYNRDCGKPAMFAYTRMVTQIVDLGTHYRGGLLCTKYRRQPIVDN